MSVCKNPVNNAKGILITLSMGMGHCTGAGPGKKLCKCTIFRGHEIFRKLISFPTKISCLTSTSASKHDKNINGPFSIHIRRVLVVLMGHNWVFPHEKYCFN